MLFPSFRSVLLLMAVAAAGLMQGCGADEPKTVAAASHCLSDSLRSIITIDTVRFRPRERELNLTGKITFDQDRLAQVFATFGGQVQRVYVSLGDRVRRGQPLATLYSADMASLAQQAAAARADLTIAQKQMEATRDLYEGGLASQRDFLTAQQAVQKAQAEVDRTNETLRLFGSKTAATYTLTAPMDGFVVEKNLSEGSVVPSGMSQDAFTISALQEVWVVANVYESDLSLIRSGLPVTVSTLAYPDRLMKATIEKVSNVLDPQTKVATVRVRLQNPDLSLKPEMFAKVQVRVASPGSAEPTIPADAVVFDGGNYYIVALPDTSCEPKVVPVTIASTVGNTIYLANPLPKGLRLVVKNQLLVYTDLTSH